MTARDQHIPGDDLVAYLLGEEPQVGAAEIERHIDACQSCREEYAGLAETLAALALQVPAAVPTPGLRDAMLAAAADASPTRAPATAAPARRAPRFAVRMPVWGAGVALAAAIGAAALVVLVLPANRDGVVSARLSGVTGSVQVAAGRAALDSADFAVLPEGKTYEMWVIREGAVRPAGLFMARSGFVPVAGRVIRGDVVAVTAEPAGGSGAPTTTPVAEARID
jgi:anti-sigma factor RsiW